MKLADVPASLQQLKSQLRPGQGVPLSQGSPGSLQLFHVVSACAAQGFSTSEGHANERG